MSLSERIQQINREISATVERAIAELRQDLTQRLRASSDEILRHVGEIAPQLPSSFLAHEDLGPATEQLARDAASAAVVEVREAAAAIDRSRSQAEVLAALLRESARFASRAAVLIVRGGEMRGWGGHGVGDAEPAIRALSFAPAPPAPAPAAEPPTPREAELEAAPELEVEAEPETAESAAAAPELTALPELPDETAAETPAATVYQPIPRDSRETLRPVPPLAAPEPEPRPEAAPATTRFTAPLPQVNPQSQPQSTPPGNAEETVLLQRSGLREAA